MSKFQVGEVVEAWVHAGWEAYGGPSEGWLEVTLIRLDAGRWELDMPSLIPDSIWTNMWADESTLRKKRPPASSSEQSAGSWEDVMREFTQPQEESA